MAQAAEHGIEMIDMVVVNLYAFEKTVAGGGRLRHLHREHRHRRPVDAALRGEELRERGRGHAPESYDAILAEMRANEGATLRDTRAKLALDVFQTTAAYDGAIAAWMGAQLEGEGSAQFPAERMLRLQKVQDLRYGENPRQAAAFYRRDGYANAEHSLPMPSSTRARSCRTTTTSTSTPPGRPCASSTSRPASS